MPVISSVKESFALAGVDIAAREKVISQATVAGTDDWYYYRGLTLLQKLSAALDSSSAASIARSPTEQEKEMLKEMAQHLKNYKDQFAFSSRYTELESRFYLLTWFINGDKSKTFVQDALSLNLPLAEQQPSSVDQSSSSTAATAASVDTATKKSYPSSLDEALFDNDKVMRGLMDKNELHQLKDTAWPTVQQYWAQFDVEQQMTILERLLWKPVTSDAVPIASYLATLWRPFETSRRDVLAENVSRLPLHNLTLDQMDELSTLLPAILHVESFVSLYMEKLVPNVYAQQQEGLFDQKPIQVWEGDAKWDSYLEELDAFADKLVDGPFRMIKARITFQKLRSTLLRGELDQQLLLTYLSQSRVKKGSDAASPIPSRSSLFGPRSEQSDIKARKATISAQDEKLVVEEYLSGLLRAQKLTTLESFGSYFDQKSFLEPLQAKVMLTSGLVENEEARSWSKVLGNAGFEELVKETTLAFGLATLHKTNNSLTKDDPMPVHVVLKNVPRLTMRIFPIDLYNYWKLHPQANTIEDGNDLNVDGLCPVYEHQLDYSNLPSLQRIEETFVFGGPQHEKAIVPEVFTDRGAWMIDFIGGQDQSRAIIQKGYLRHVMQKSAAGHILLILDEVNKPLKDCNIWLENESYVGDENGNILIPYRSNDSKQVRALIATADGYCQPLEFCHEQESYSLDASFYLNYESLIPNKRTKVIITPTLKIQDKILPLKLLEKISLEVVTTNANDVRSSTTLKNLVFEKGNVIECEFSVPGSLDAINLTLSAKVKTLSEDQPWKQLECAREIRSGGSDQDQITAPQLRVDGSGYRLYVIGKNGEPHRDHSLNLSFRHTLTQKSFDITMQSNKNGYITLGALNNIESFSIDKPWKSWELLGDNWNSAGKRDEAALPLNIQYSANTEFKIPFAMTEGCNATLFQTGVRRNPVVDYTKRLQYTGSTVTVVEGLPEGTYCFYLSRPHQRHDNLIEITIIDNKSTQCDNKLWNNWLFGDRFYGEMTGDVIKKPLEIQDVKTTDEHLTLKLKEGTASPRSALAVITTSSFLPALADSLATTQLKNAQSRRLSCQPLAQNGMDHIYLSGRKLGEEYQYILNRSKEDMYAGSTLKEPSLLVNPKKNGPTTVKTRSTRQGNEGFTSKAKQAMSNMAQHSLKNRAFCRMMSSFNHSDINFAYLNQRNHILVLRPNEDGEFVVQRSQIGDGNLVQAIILSGDQAVSRTIVLSDVDMTLKLNDQRQSDQNLDIDAAYLRNKVITSLSPSHPQASVEMDPTQHEFELVDSQDALMDLFKLLAPNYDTALKDFGFLRQWTTWNDEEKLKTHDRMNSHELNLWIKYKDTAYFDANIKPFIKNKLEKTFMDDYLVDANLAKYFENLHLFQQLTTPEKALLARRVPSALPVVLRLFKESYKPSLSDQPFDTVLAGSLLTAPTMDAVTVECASLGYSPSGPSVFGGAAPHAVSFGSAAAVVGASRMAKRSFAAPAPPAAPMSMMYSASSALDTTTEDMDLDEVSEHDEPFDFNDDVEDDEDESLMALRDQAAKRRRIQKPYEYMAPTSEWSEKGYYDDESVVINVNQFWIDYLENDIDVFVSGNAIYATTNITEMIFALALTDLPMKGESNYERLADPSTGSIGITAKTPLMVFYKSLKKCTQPPVTNPTLLLGQHIFERNQGANDSADDQHIVDPDQLLVRTPYGWHLAVSNISTKTVVCELTLQIPTGAVPLGDTPYCQSKSIMIQPYTTWHEVVGNFYFPVYGTFHQLAVTVGEQLKSQLDTGIQEGNSSNSVPTMALINQTQPMVLTVRETDEQKRYLECDTSLSAYASWSVVNSTGTGKDILAYVENHSGKLDTLDWSLVMWRMTNQPFARSLLTLLATNKYYEGSIYAYGVYHGFTDIIADLLVQERSRLLENTGLAFDSPLVKWRSAGQEYPKVFDYFPIANARVHPLGGSSEEIANQEFYQQYDRFLDYLNQRLDRKADDYVILSVYLILQGRIGEAHQSYQLSRQLSNQHGENNSSEEAVIQRDYLGAYLATRVKVGDQLDISSIKAIMDKYKSCGSLRWRNLFNHLNDFVVQVEKGGEQQDTIGSGLPTTESNTGITTDPVFDFSIKDNQVVVRYANVTQLQVRLYNINAEVMFSSQPFLNNTNKMSDYGWVKANHVETVDLSDHQSDEDVALVDQEDDFEWIGVNKICPRRHAVPIPLVGNMLVEVHAHGKTQCQTHFNHALTVHVSEQYGVARVLATNSDEAKSLSGVYVKVYAKLDSGRTEFWKDGYTSLTGVFDYISVTHGNALVGDDTLEQAIKKIKKLSLFFSSAQHGVVVKEACPPL